MHYAVIKFYYHGCRESLNLQFSPDFLAAGQLYYSSSRTFKCIESNHNNIKIGDVGRLLVRLKYKRMFYVTCLKMKL